MEHAEFKPKYEHADFTEFCREYLAIKYSEIELLGYKIEYKLEERKNILNFDKMLIIRLFDNIINNSIKYNKKGTRIYFNYKVTKENTIIDIADNGIGIKVDNPSKLFEPFIVGNESRTKGLGTGLGLYIAKQIVDLHNGEILIIDKPKSPYKFHIQIRFKR
jgi:signal transduction histidine kinase